jgi:hypothetical protein
LESKLEWRGEEATCLLFSVKEIPQTPMRPLLTLHLQRMMRPKNSATKPVIGDVQRRQRRLMYFGPTNNVQSINQEPKTDYIDQLV